MSLSYNLTEDGGAELRPGVCWMVSCLTIVVFDLILHIPEDINLFFQQQIRLPTLAYAAARASTLATLIFTLTFDADKTDSVSITEFNVQQSVHFAIRRAFFLSSVVQRGLTSLILYIRVRALYRSNFYVQVPLALLLLAVMASCLVVGSLSGLISGVFDLTVFSAILLKLGVRPAVFETPGSTAKPGLHVTFWSPFRPSRVYQVTDRFLFDSLLAVLVSIIVKIPQIVFVSSRHDGDWLLHAMYIDVVISCIAASHVFRDMKLGIHSMNGKAGANTLSLRQSKMQFVMPTTVTSEA